MTTENDVFTVHHNPTEMRFEILVSGNLAELLYQVDNDTIIFHHTFVPHVLEGKGIGSKLAKAGLDYAKAKSMSVVPVCSFVRAYIQSHPEYQPLLKS